MYKIPSSLPVCVRLYAYGVVLNNALCPGGIHVAAARGQAILVILARLPQRVHCIFPGNRPARSHARQDNMAENLS